MKYPSFPSIERLENIYCVVSEKVDGTNGLIEVTRLFPQSELNFDTEVYFGSRNRYLSLKDDNHGFCNFYHIYFERIIDAAEHLINMSDSKENEELMFNYPIRIYGEWFGRGIQRTYGLTDKFFMPFSTFLTEALLEYNVPNIVHPAILYTGKFTEDVVHNCMTKLAHEGSQVIKDYPSPEGIVIYFPKYNFRLKYTFEGSKWEKAIPKPEQDKKPIMKEDIIQCHVCGKRLYLNKQTKELQCNNIHCKSSPNYKGE